MPALAAHNIEPWLIDGANADHRELRKVLWAKSGKRAVYPQVFAAPVESAEAILPWREHGSGATTGTAAPAVPHSEVSDAHVEGWSFIGDWQDIFGMNERGLQELEKAFEPLRRKK
jgi:hypothetical protein